MNHAKDEEKEVTRKWLAYDRSLTEFWFRLVEYSILTALLNYVGEKTGNTVIKVAFYFSCTLLWRLMEDYTSYIFKRHLTRRRGTLVGGLILICSIIFSCSWILLIMSIVSGMLSADAL